MPSRQWTRFYRRTDLSNLEFIHAQFVTHRFARHAHDYYVVGMIQAGLQTFSYRGEKHATTPYGLILLNPDEPHTGEPASAGGFTYKAIYPSVVLMRSLMYELTDATTLAFFRAPVIYDAELAQRVFRLHQILVMPNSTLAAESDLLGILADFIRRYSDIRVREIGTKNERPAVQRVREYLEEQFDQNVSLTQLASLVALSPYYLAHVFAAEVGMPPHTYLESVRIRHAQRLLMLGHTPADVAFSTGFADQSHFTHRFKRLIGVTPGQYVNKILQDG
jgi:AraC-like DNA-binding protein